MEPPPPPFFWLRCILQSLSCGMRSVIAPLRSRASFFHAGKFASEACRVFHLGGNLLGGLRIAMQQIADDVLHLLDQIATDFRVAQLVFRLRFENRVFEADCHRSDESFAYIIALVFLFREIVDRF